MSDSNKTIQSDEFKSLAEGSLDYEKSEINAAFIAAANPAAVLELIAAARASSVGIGRQTDEPNIVPDLLEALRPLAECEIIEPDVPLLDTDIARYPFTMGEIRAARAAIARAEAPPSGDRTGDGPLRAPPCLPGGDVDAERVTSEGGWIEWRGGDNPMPGVDVEWGARDGATGVSYCASGWNWNPSQPARDIIAYRLIQPTARLSNPAGLSEGGE